MRLRRVLGVAARRIHFGQEHAQAGFEFERVAIIGARHASFLAALQLADLRPAGSEQGEHKQRDEPLPLEGRGQAAG
ncbi:MAG: hypothetical protein BroJett013_17350 [Alphaproteobacteria bacterium]|nr:MAG: hypothetical protein BroJett013_17350 [Alphaproteobacteria bacterium]